MAPSVTLGPDPTSGADCRGVDMPDALDEGFSRRDFDMLGVQSEREGWILPIRDPEPAWAQDHPTSQMWQGGGPKFSHETSD